MVTKSDFIEAVEEFGEVFVVLDSGVEYEVHGTRGYEITDGVVEVEGLSGDEWIIARFSIESIEHFYTHKEV